MFQLKKKKKKDFLVSFFFFFLILFDDEKQSSESSMQIPLSVYGYPCDVLYFVSFSHNFLVLYHATIN